MTSALVVLPGMVLVAGVLLILAAFRPEHVRLDDALAALGGEARPESGPTPEPGERLGAWWLHRRPVAVTKTTRRALELKGRTLPRHYSLKVTGALAGFVTPMVLGALATFGLGLDASVPLVVSVVGAVVGFLLPDLLLRGQAEHLASDATESLLTYFDLVTLERMANQSATQSLHAAAAISDNAVFAQLRGALDRARLEQRMPFAELKALGQRLELPALVDLADVMRLDESGAALSNTLRARVKELRDAHLTDLKMTATRISERMTVFMVIPSLLFGLLFLAPPILRLIQS